MNIKENLKKIGNRLNIKKKENLPLIGGLILTIILAGIYIYQTALAVESHISPSSSASENCVRWIYYVGNISAELTHIESEFPQEVMAENTSQYILYAGILPSKHLEKMEVIYLDNMMACVVMCPDYINVYQVYFDKCYQWTHG